MSDPTGIVTAMQAAVYGTNIASYFAGTKIAVMNRMRFYLSSYFYRDDLVKAFLFDRNIRDLPKTEFIDYAAYHDHYPNEAKQCRLLSDDTEHILLLPYKEVINFIESPSAVIDVVGGIHDYTLPQEIVDLTNSNLAAFLQKQPTTRDNPILRMATFTECGENTYQCTLQKSTYFAQVRTNLTLDRPIQAANGRSLRTIDRSAGYGLPTFEQSRLVNSIGVSAIVYYRKPGPKPTDSVHDYFFMKYRRPTEAVFGNMFGTTSGVVTMPPGTQVHSLVDYVICEMRREFYRETGLDEDKDNNPIKSMIPLAFTRELMRGGKPQFFFLIEIDPMSESEFGRRFRASAEGLEEFYDNAFHNNLYTTALSPEFATNLIYALQYFRKQAGLGFDPLPLGNLSLT